MYSMNEVLWSNPDIGCHLIFMQGQELLYLFVLGRGGGMEQIMTK